MADPQDTSAQDDYLQSVLQGAPAPQDAPPPQAAAPAPQQDQSTTVAPLSVAATPPQGLNLQAPDSVADANNARAALQNPAYQPQGGGLNSGIWGLLPQNMQHGTLRNVLGALGDAFLVGSGHQAQYEPRMERQQEGLAMSDYAEHPEFAIARMAATGTPDAMKNAVTMQDNLNNVDARKAALAQSQQYHRDSLDQRKQYQDAQTQARQDNIVRTMMPQVGGMASRATDLPSYIQAYTQAEKIAQRISPNYHASDFGLVSPEDWKPGMVQGTTAGQQLSSADKGAQRDVSTANNVRSNANHIQVANINAGQRASTAAKGMNERDAGLLNQANQPGGLAAMSPTDQARVQYLTTKGGKTGTKPPLTAAAQAAAGQGPKAAPQAGSPTATGRNGEKYVLQNGKWVRTK